MHKRMQRGLEREIPGGGRGEMEELFPGISTDSSLNVHFRVDV